MLKKINQCDIYVGIWCIYMLQDVFYSAGIINQILQLIMMLWCVYAVLKHCIESTEHSAILKATLILIAMYTIYGSINIMFGESLTPSDQYDYGRYVYLQTSLKSLTPIFLFYYFTKNGLLTSDRIRVYLPFLILTCILLYYKKESAMLLATNRDEVTNNAGYYFVPLIPLLFFYSQKPVLQYIFIGVILLYVFMGMKRGAILIGAVASLVFLYANVKKSSRRTKILTILLTIIIVFGVSKYIGYMMSNSDYFTARIEQTMEGDASGRDIIYEKLLDTILTEASPFYFYFGRGADSTIKVTGTFAHQDWLETFCNNGLIGVIILFYFFFIFGKKAWNSRKYFSGMMFYSFVTLFIVTFSKTLFSMSIQDLNLAESMLLGFFAYQLSNSEENEIYETDDSINYSDCR